MGTQSQTHLRAGTPPDGQAAPRQTEATERKLRADGQGHVPSVHGPSVAGRREKWVRQAETLTDTMFAFLPACQGFPDTALHKKGLHAGENTDRRAGPAELGFPNGGPGLCILTNTTVWNQIQQ